MAFRKPLVNIGGSPSELPSADTLDAIIEPAKIGSGYTASQVYVDTHPESISFILPHFNNDIAHLTKRGGSVSSYYTTDSVYTALTLTNTGAIAIPVDALFDGTPSYSEFTVASTSSKVVIDITLHRSITWSPTTYIDFGTTVWRAQDVAVYAYNNSVDNAETVYKLAGSVTNDTRGRFFVKYQYSYLNTSAGTSYGFNKLRIVLTNFATTTPRIATIGVIESFSNGLAEPYMSRIGGELYGSVVPKTTNSIDLGGISNTFRNVYSATFTGALDGNASTATKLATSHNIAGVAFDGSADIAIPFANLTSKPTTLADYGVINSDTLLERRLSVDKQNNGDVVETILRRRRTDNTQESTLQWDGFRFNWLNPNQPVSYSGAVSVGANLSGTTASFTGHVSAPNLSRQFSIGPTSGAVTWFKIGTIGTTAAVGTSYAQLMMDVYANGDVGQNTPNWESIRFASRPSINLNVRSMLGTPHTSLMYGYVTNGTALELWAKFPAAYEPVVTFLVNNVNGTGSSFGNLASTVTEPAGITYATTVTMYNDTYLKQEGGTLTGGLAGVTGTFSGDVTAPNITNHIGAGASAHAVATTSVNGFMASTDKTKLDGVATGATANSPNATLLARANHTGTQAQSTVTDLTSDLALKAPLASPTFTGTVSSSTITSTGVVTNRSNVLTRLTNTPTGTTFTWTLTNGNQLVLTLTSSTGNVTVTTASPTQGAKSILIVVGHATTTRDVTITQSGVTFRMTGKTNGSSITLDTIAINGRACYELFWETTTKCFISRIYAGA